MTITYTFPADSPIPQLRNQTVTGGIPVSHPQGPAVKFETKVGGRQVVALVAGKPELADAVADFQRMKDAEAAAEAAAFAAAVPGYEELERAARKLSLAKADDFEQLDRFMDSGEARSCQPRCNTASIEALNAAYEELAARYPRAALYVRLERVMDHTSWADNTGRAGAARRALEMLSEGRPIEEAIEAAAVRRT